MDTKQDNADHGTHGHVKKHRVGILTGYAFGMVIAGVVDVMRGFDGGFAHIGTGLIIAAVDVVTSMMDERPDAT